MIWGGGVMHLAGFPAIRGPLEVRRKLRNGNLGRLSNGRDFAEGFGQLGIVVVERRPTHALGLTIFLGHAHRASAGGAIDNGPRFGPRNAQILPAMNATKLNRHEKVFVLGPLSVVLRGFQGDFRGREARWPSTTRLTSFRSSSNTPGSPKRCPGKNPRPKHRPARKAPPTNCRTRHKPKSKFQSTTRTA